MKIRPLIVSPSPRDIKSVQDAFDTIVADKLMVKYFRKPKAMEIIQHFFHEHKEFTHLAIKPDDLIVNKEHYQMMVNTLKSNDYPVLGGLCNVGVESDLAYKLAINYRHLPSIIRSRRIFRWVDVRQELDDIIKRQGGNHIIKVKFAGMPFMFIRRDILNEITLDSDAKFNTIEFGSRRWHQSGSYDVVFCNKCDQQGIPIHVNTDVRMLHLKDSAEANIYFINRKTPQIKYIDIKGNEHDLTGRYYDMTREQITEVMERRRIR